jgi:hypothetical protein
MEVSDHCEIFPDFIAVARASPAFNAVRAHYQN